MTEFRRGPLTDSQARYLTQITKLAEQFTRLTVAAPLNIVRNAGIPALSLGGDVGGTDVILAEVVSSTGTPPVHTVKRKTRDTSNNVVDYTPATTYTQVLDPLGETIPNGTIVAIFEIEDFPGWWWALPVLAAIDPDNTLDVVTDLCTSGGTGASLGSCGDVKYSYGAPGADWLLADGSTVARSAYPCLNTIAAAAGYAAPWGPGDGATTFEIVDLGAGPPLGYLKTIDDTPTTLKVVKREITLTPGTTPGDPVCAVVPDCEDTTDCCTPFTDYDGPGWYCVEDEFGDCNTVVQVIGDGDQCADVVYCSGPYETEEEATAACGPVTVSCAAEPIARRLTGTFSAASGNLAFLDGLVVTLTYDDAFGFWYGCTHTDDSCGLGLSREVTVTIECFDTDVMTLKLAAPSDPCASASTMASLGGAATGSFTNPPFNCVFSYSLVNNLCSLGAAAGAFTFTVVE